MKSIHIGLGMNYEVKFLTEYLGIWWASAHVTIILHGNHSFALIHIQVE